MVSFYIAGGKGNEGKNTPMRNETNNNDNSPKTPCGPSVEVNIEVEVVRNYTLVCREESIE